MPSEFRLPDLGEGLKEAVLVDWKVKEGESIALDQVLAEVETDKATSTLPSPVAGKVTRLHFKAGDTVPVGAVLVSFDGAVKSEGEKGRGGEGEKKAEPAAARPPAPKLGPAKPIPATAAKPADEREQKPDRPILAAPATRRLAREHEIDLRKVRGTGPGGRVTAEDVRAFIASGGRPRAEARSQPAGEPMPGITRPPMPDFAQWGEVVREKASAIRKRIAQRLSVAFHSVVPVTHMDEADVTAVEENRQQAAKRAEELGVKLTLLPCVVKAAVAALKRHPSFNASFDEEAGEIVLKKYFHIGIAVDSPQGLLVPVVRDADRKTVIELAKEIAQLAEKARAGKLSAEEMRGGSFTITNIGALGGTAFTPIINWPEAAILGTARTQERPALRNGVLVNRKLLPLMLSFDHRITDGAQAARFMNDIRMNIENPLLLMMDS